MKHKNTRKIGYEPTTIAIISTIASVGGAVIGGVMQAKSMSQQKKYANQAADAEAKRADLERRSNDAQARKQKIAQQREARMLRSKIITDTAQANVGPAGTSGSIGATGAVSTTEAANRSNIDASLGFSTAIGTQMTDANTAMGKAAGWRDIGQAGQSIFNSFGGFDTIFSAFKTNIKPYTPSAGGYSKAPSIFTS